MLLKLRLLFQPLSLFYRICGPYLIQSMKNSRGLSINKAVEFLISEKAMCNHAYRFTLASERAICFRVSK